jgi:glutathione S-transferase
VWVNFAEVEATLRTINAPATVRSDGQRVYAVPAIVDPATSRRPLVVLSDPSLIADYLEQEYPARPVFPEGSRAIQAVFARYIQDVFIKPLLPIMVPLSHQRLPEHVQLHLRSDSTAGTPSHNQSGKSSHILTGQHREQAWLAVKGQFDALAAMLDKNHDGNGTLVQGQNVTYADFALCSVLIWIERMAPHDWQRVRQWNNGRWAHLFEACRNYMDVC